MDASTKMCTSSKEKWRGIWEGEEWGGDGGVGGGKRGERKEKKEKKE